MFNIRKKRVILTILFFLTLSIIVFYWKHPTLDATNELNTVKYNKIIQEMHIKNPRSLDQAENFIIHNHNIYGILTSLYLSKTYILNNELDKALISLENSVKYTNEENLKIILKINIAKIKMQKNENQKAMEILKKIENHNWNNTIENMKGDIFMDINNKKQAIKSWEKSLSMENSNAFKEIINMKINDLKE